MKTKWELSRFAILRKDDFFEIVSPSGGLYQLDREMVQKLLELHNQKPLKIFSEIEQFAIDEFLITETEKEIKDPFQIDRVLENLDRKNLKILTLCDLSLLITRNCNYQCRGCSVSARPIAFKPSKVDWKKIISDGASFGAINLGITGGEPILPQQIDFVCELVAWARNLGYRKVVIATNGCYLPKYINQLQEAGATRFSVSYHGSAEYAHEYTGNRNAKRYSESAIEAILGSNAYLTINCVVTRKNFDQLDSIVAEILPLIENHPHAYLRFSPLISVGDAKENSEYQLTRDDYILLFAKIANWKAKFDRLVRLTCDEECFADDPMLCDAGLTYAIVNEQGIVSACDLLETILPVSNLKTSFLEAWNNSRLWKDYREITPINQQCVRCGEQNRKFCFGRCKALSYLRHGSLLMNKKPKEGRCLE